MEEILVQCPLRRLKHRIFPSVYVVRGVGIDLKILVSLTSCLELETHRGHSQAQGLWVLSFLTPNLESHILSPMAKENKKYFAFSDHKIKFSKGI